jgi:hypothetical protein
MKPSYAVMIAALVPSALGILLLTMRIYGRKLYNKLSTEGAVTKGTVVGLKMQTGSGRRPPLAEIEFVDSQNRTYGCDTHGYYEWKDWVGRQVTVAYDVENPHRNVVLEDLQMMEAFLGKRTPWVLAIVGPLVLCLGLVMRFVLHL